jgi:hypothetical protein
MEEGLIVRGATVPSRNVQITVRAEGDGASVMIELRLVPPVDDALRGQVGLIRVRLRDAKLREIVGTVETQPGAPRCVAAHGSAVHHVELAIFLSDSR